MTVIDVTEGRRAEERQHLVNHELSHRMKNLLAVVQAVSAQTMRNAPDLTTAGEALAARLVALGRARDILLDDRTDGAEMDAVVAAALGLQDDR